MCTSDEAKRYIDSYLRRTSIFCDAMEPVVIGPRGELLSVAACALICGIGLWIASNGNTQAAAVTELGKIDGRGPTTLRPVLVRSG